MSLLTHINTQCCAATSRQRRYCHFHPDPSLVILATADGWEIRQERLLSVGQIDCWRWSHSVSQGVTESSSVAVTQTKGEIEGCRKKIENERPTGEAKWVKSEFSC